MTTAMTRHEPADEAIELALVDGDLSRLTSPQRRTYYLRVCESVGLNPLTKPFEYLRLNGKLILYAGKNCTDQLRALRGVSIDDVRRVISNGLCEVTAVATVDGRKDTDVGAVNVENLKGEALANAVMKAHTKAKRRVTLSICGLSMIDDSEVEDIRGAERVREDDVAPRPQLAPKPASTPPPALDAPNPMEALYSKLAAAITLAGDMPTLKKAWNDVSSAAKATRITLEMRGALAELKDQRKKGIESPRERVEDVLANNPLPESWGGPPDVDAVEEQCVVCRKPLGSSAAVQVETADGEVGFRHQGCALREPGED